MNVAKILVYGAGPLGSLFAARLQQGGNRVSILARTTPVPTPTIDRLLRYYEPDAPQVPEGSAEIPLRWGGLVVWFGGLTALISGSVLLVKRLAGREQH